MRRRFYSTGQFARRASVSVRTLRFYDNAGVLTPSERSEAGYRRYTDEDLLRLQQVLALKFLGLSLDEIRRCLATGPERLRESLSRQKAMLREKRAHLDVILRAIEDVERHATAEQSTIESVVRLIEVIQMQQKNDWVNKYFSPEQQKQLETLQASAYSEAAQAKLAARGPWTEEDQERVSAEWAAVGSELRRLVAAGADPKGAEGQAWAARFNALISAFTQNAPEIEAGLNTFWKLHDALLEAEQPMGPRYTAEEQAFMNEALFASRQCEPRG